MSLADLLKQKAEIDRKIEIVQNEARAKAISDVKALMAEHGLTPADLVPPAARNSSKSVTNKPVAAKYRDEQGNSWSGRGLKPKWLTAALASGKRIDEFAI